MDFIGWGVGLAGAVAVAIFIGFKVNSKKDEAIDFAKRARDNVDEDVRKVLRGRR